MVGLRVSERQNHDMGQTSSQLQSPVPEDAMTRKGKSEAHTLKKRRRKSAVESALNEEQESARALLQMKGVALEESDDRNDGLNQAASQQLLLESSPLRIPEQSGAVASYARGSPAGSWSRGRKRKREMGGNPKGHDKAIPSIEHSPEGITTSPDLPATPPRQIAENSSSPYSPSLSRSNQALDEIPTDDEDVTQFQEEFGTQGKDIYGFSQQLLDNTDTQAEQNVDPPDCLSTRKSTKRKRDNPLVSGSQQGSEEQQPLANGDGQYTLACDLDSDPFPDLSTDNLSSADTCLSQQANQMPIDPELHSMSQLPPSVNLSQLDDDLVHVPQKRKKKRKIGGFRESEHSKGVGGSHDANPVNAPLYNDFSMDHDANDMQDYVLPGYEDLQRRSSPELGSPLMEGFAHKGLEFLDDRVQSKAARKGKKSVSHANKPSRQKAKDPTRDVKESSSKGGPFTNAEASKLDKFRNDYCNANDMPVWKFNNQIQSTMRGNSEVVALFNEIQDLLPYRPRISVQKFCRRRFHNFSVRGTWTAEDDEMLKQAVAEKGKQWKAVGELIGRMGEDCRDRYRNYIVNAENRNHEQWTPEEVRSLCSAVLESVEIITNERRQDREDRYGKSWADESDSNMEEEDMKAINWQAISDRMHGQRSRLQCSGKWRQLEKQEKHDVAQSILDQRGLQGRRLKAAKNPWRTKDAAKKVANMRPGDMHALVQAILDCGVSAEGNIPWKALGDEEMRVTWNATAKQAAWSKLKQEVRGFQSMDYRDVASHLLTRIEEEASGNLEERWDPEVHGDVTARKPKRSKNGKAREAEGTVDGLPAARKRRKAKKINKETPLKSNEFVRDSDEELEAPTSYQPRNDNRFEPLWTPVNAPTGAGKNDQSQSDISHNGLHQQQQPGNGPTDYNQSEYVVEDSLHTNHGMSTMDPDISPSFDRHLRVALQGAS